ncbi:unnamed protein product [Rotaria magnacalcarata]|uniref:RING-type domain-containing protein n=2 Tax=Rotaria magnacalcarata TaxID=392030 RepID=A0A814XVC1_9BILA|nr:unnamed protein product [Rotaria magnacalcarata]
MANEEKKKNNSSLRRYSLINNDQVGEENRANSNREQPIPISIEYLSTPATISNKRRRSSITNGQSLSTQVSSNSRDFIYDRNFSMTPTVGTRKRSAQDDLATFTTHQFIHERQQCTHKRARYENSNNTELENQPPRLTTKRRSIFFAQQHEDNHRSLPWNHQSTTNDISLFFNDTPPSLSHSTTTYHRTSSLTYHEHNPSDQYSSLLTEHHPSSIFHNNSLITTDQKSTIPKPSKTNIRLLSPQLNCSSPLRTTNFLFDNKQQTIIPTGNISPAHSDSSTESTSTCSSDEQLHHHHHHQYRFYQPQPWRSYRERENYEQLLDLAEKLSDPNRFNKVDIQKFLSYRYKTPSIASSSSKQTACVICMSHFKNGQHIRVLPCQHEYHSKCIARWFAMNSSCPICRRDNFLSSC